MEFPEIFGDLWMVIWVSEMGVKRFGGKMMVERSRVQSQNTEDLVLV